MNNYPWLDQYLLSKKCAQKDYKVEWEWHRYMINDKLFAALCLDKEGREILTLKLDPLEGEFLRGQYPEIVPGHYCDKRHWNSIRLDGHVPDDMMRDMIDKSYNLVLHKLTKRAQKAIEET